MIKINLLGDEETANHSGVLWIAGYFTSLVACLVVFFFLNSLISSSIASLDSQVKTQENQLAKLRAVTKEVKDLENKRKELRDKLAVIATLKRSKAGPVRVMDHLNMALPERAWITQIQEQEKVLKIHGFALDNQTIANFMKGLEASEYFGGVDLIETKQVKWKGAGIKQFTVQAKVSYVGKIAAQAGKEAVQDAGGKKT